MKPKITQAMGRSEGTLLSAGTDVSLDTASTLPLQEVIVTLVQESDG